MTSRVGVGQRLLSVVAGRQTRRAGAVEPMPPATRLATAVRRTALLLGLPAVLVTTWWLASAGSTNFLWPPLAQILAAFRETWFGPPLTEHVLPSLVRFAFGYTVALPLGVAIGLAVGLSRPLRAVLEPVLEFLRALPPPVLIPILILAAGIGDVMKVLVIVFGCLWPVLLNTVEGVRGVDEVLADTCRSYRIGGVARLRHLVLRSASPQIVTGARQAQSIGIILMVISEMVAANNGLGFLIKEALQGFAIPEMWSGVLLLGLLGVVLSLLFRLAENRVLVWYHGIRAIQRER